MKLVVENSSAFWHLFEGGEEACILDASKFYNQGVDVVLMNGIVKDLTRQLTEIEADICLTAAASGNIITYELADKLNIPEVVYARKGETLIHKHSGSLSTHGDSYTGGYETQLVVARDLLKPENRVLVVDDFSDRGKMGLALMGLVELAEARVAGYVVGVNKKPAGGEIVIGDELDRLGVGRDKFVYFIGIDSMGTGVVQFEGFSAGFSLMRDEVNNL